MRTFSVQDLHYGFFAGAVNMAMDGRLCSSEEYQDLLSALEGKDDDVVTRRGRSETVVAEIKSRDTPLMRELLMVMEANWQDLERHFAKHRNAGRPVYPAVKRIKKAVAKQAPKA